MLATSSAISRLLHVLVMICGLSWWWSDGSGEEEPRTRRCTGSSKSFPIIGNSMYGLGRGSFASGAKIPNST